MAEDKMVEAARVFIETQQREIFGTIRQLSNDPIYGMMADFANEQLAPYQKALDDLVWSPFTEVLIHPQQADLFSSW
jgi:hypothetical protein